MTDRLHTFDTPRSEDAAVTGSETATLEPTCARRVSNAALAIAGLVVASTLVRFGIAQAFTTPWIAPDEMVYGMLGEGLWSHGTLTLRTFDAPYYSLLTPALIGAPLELADLATGIQWARLLQCLAMSLVAVPTFIWTRRLATPRWAVAAAAITLADRHTDAFALAQRRKQPAAAAEIQQSLLPPRISRVTGGEVAGNVLPSYEVAGDWFDVIENPDGIWISIADGLGGSTRAAACGSSFATTPTTGNEVLIAPSRVGRTPRGCPRCRRPANRTSRRARARAPRARRRARR